MLLQKKKKKKKWNTTAKIRCHTQTVIDHFRKDTSLKQEAVCASMQQKGSYFD